MCSVGAVWQGLKRKFGLLVVVLFCWFSAGPAGQVEYLTMVNRLASIQCHLDMYDVLNPE